MDATERTLTKLVTKIDDVMVSRDSTVIRRWQPPCPKFLRSEEAFGRLYIGRDRMDIPTQHGKDLVDFFIRNPIPKLYMFIEKPNLTCPRKKLDHPQKLPLMNMFMPSLQCYMMKGPMTPCYSISITPLEGCGPPHNKISMARCQRRVFDAVERGSYMWVDSQSIQNDGFLALRAATSARVSDTQEHKERLCLE